MVIKSKESVVVRVHTQLGTDFADLKRERESDPIMKKRFSENNLVRKILIAGGESFELIVGRRRSYSPIKVLFSFLDPLQKMRKIR